MAYSIVLSMCGTLADTPVRIMEVQVSSSVTSHGYIVCNN